MRNNERMRRLRFGSGADLADLSHNPTLARCRARSLALISCSPELDPGSSERVCHAVCCVLRRKGIIKLHAKCVARSWCEALTSAQVMTTRLRLTGISSQCRHSISHRALTGIDHKLRLIMS